MTAVSSTDQQVIVDKHNEFRGQASPTAANMLKIVSCKITFHGFTKYCNNSLRRSGADQRKHQSSASLAFVRGIYRWPVNSPHKRRKTLKMFPFDDVIMPSASAKELPHSCAEALFCTLMFLFLFFYHVAVGCLPCEADPFIWGPSHKRHSIDRISFSWSQSDLVTPYDDIDLGQPWLG